MAVRLISSSRKEGESDALLVASADGVFDQPRVLSVLFFQIKFDPLETEILLNIMLNYLLKNNK